MNESDKVKGSIRAESWGKVAPRFHGLHRARRLQKTQEEPASACHIRAFQQLLLAFQRQRQRKAENITRHSQGQMFEELAKAANSGLLTRKEGRKEANESVSLLPGEFRVRHIAIGEHSHPGAAIKLGRKDLLHDSHSAKPFELEVESAVFQPLIGDDAAQASDRADRRPPLIVSPTDLKS